MPISYVLILWLSTTWVGLSNDTIKTAASENGSISMHEFNTQVSCEKALKAVKEKSKNGNYLQIDGVCVAVR